MDGRRAATSTWTLWSPTGDAARADRIHISATPASADAALGAASLYCRRNDLPFKFLPARHILHVTSSKDGDRRASGKFITIHPTREADLYAHLTPLDAALEGLDGPYVRPYLRWRNGPVLRAVWSLHQTIDRPGTVSTWLHYTTLDSGAPSWTSARPDLTPPWVRIPYSSRSSSIGWRWRPRTASHKSGGRWTSRTRGVYEAELDLAAHT